MQKYHQIRETAINVLCTSDMSCMQQQRTANYRKGAIYQA